MDCKHTPGLMHGYVDRELDGDRLSQLDAHLRACPACTRLIAGQQALSAAIRSGARRFAAPPGFAAALGQALDGSPRGSSPRHILPRSMLRLAASFAAVAVLSSGLTWLALTPAPIQIDDDRAFAAAIVDSHVHALMTNHLTSVVSSDQHTVKPWFAGRVEVSPPVVDLAANGFPLVGGRVDYVARRSAAVVVYRRRQHLIDVYVWADAGSAAALPLASARHGYNTIRWADQGLAYAAVSDLNADDLSRLVALIRSR